VKRLLVLVIAFLLFCSTAQATLIDNLDGTVTDDDFGIMWLADANLAATETFGVSGINTNGQMTWETAKNWIVGMNTSNYLGYSNWRLPTAFNQDGSGPDSFFNNTDSEMGHLFYIELSGTAMSDPFVFTPISGSGDPDLALFANLQDWFYWSGDRQIGGPGDNIWIFDFNRGLQGGSSESGNYYAFAVRDNIPASGPIPEPSTIALLGIGLAGLAGAEVRRRRKKTKQ